MYTLANKWDIDIKFGPPYAPWSNGLNERNHASADKAVQCFLKDHPRASLQEAVNNGAWTHNTNTSKAGFIPMQLMLGTLPKFPEIRTKEDDVEDIISVDEHLRDMADMRRAFMENEFKRRISIGENQRHKKYYDEKYEKGDEVYYQDGTGKEWQ